MTKYMRSRINGVVFDYNELMAKNPAIEVVSEQEAFPERFIPEAFRNIPQRVDISIPKEVIEAPAQVSSELIEEASRPFGRKQRVGKPNIPEATSGLFGGS